MRLRSAQTLRLGDLPRTPVMRVGTVKSRGETCVTLGTDYKRGYGGGDGTDKSVLYERRRFVI